MCRCVVGAATALSGCEGSGGHGPMGVALLGQEGKGVRLNTGSDNQHVVWGGGWQSVRHGRRWKRCPSCQQKCRSGIVAVRRQGGGFRDDGGNYGGDGGDNGIGTVFALAVTRAGVRQPSH